MGGNALKSVVTKRLPDLEYKALIIELLPKLQTLFNTDLTVLKNYHKKPDHGDLDIIVSTYHGWNVDLINVLKDELGATEVFKNSYMYSFDYNEFQVDLILMGEENYESATLYYQHGDLGNLLGYLVHKYSMKYGHEGLMYTVKDAVNGNVIEHFNISKNKSDILYFMGLDQSKWEKGFDDKTDIFEYVTSCVFYNSDSYNPGNQNSSRKHRNSKRKMYHDFLDWKEDKNKFNAIFTEQEMLDRVETYFGIDLNIEIEKILKQQHLYKESNHKFNANLVTEKYGFAGKDLGLVMKNFNDSFNGDKSARRDFILDNDMEKIWTLFINQKRHCYIT